MTTTDGLTAINEILLADWDIIYLNQLQGKWLDFIKLNFEKGLPHFQFKFKKRKQILQVRLFCGTKGLW